MSTQGGANPGISRRSALGVIGLGLAAPGALARRRSMGGSLYEISLAEWSLHRAIFAEELSHLDFITQTREVYGLSGVEYVSVFFKDHARDEAMLKEMNTRANDAGVEQLLIMVDREGNLGDPNDAERTKAVENHVKWLDAAVDLGCHSIRVNAASEGERAEQARLAADGLRRLSELGDERGINVIVENHGGFSSDGAWLSDVMRRVDHPRCGTLPDFGNFCTDWSRVNEPDAWYDRYLGVRELMPYAKAVSAKSHEFDDAGDEVRTDYAKMMRIVLDAGYRGYVGIEYEGDQHSEKDGILATKRLLERLRSELAPEYD